MNDLTYPSSLPHAIELPMEALLTLVVRLTLDEVGHPNGSSYAVGANARPGQRILQMSDASARRAAAYLRPADPQAWLDEIGFELVYKADR